MSSPPGNPLAYEGDAWTCPVTGVRIAKDLQHNVEQRLRVWKRCQEDAEYRTVVNSLCRQSFLVWCNLFAWTYVVIDHGPSGRKARAGGNDVPFITWPCQDAAIHDMMQCAAEGRNVACLKSRDMGMSWLVCAWAVWECLYVPGTQWKMGSLLKESVDNPGDPDALFTKIDYILEKLPSWMVGIVVRKRFLFNFKKLGTTIRGGATTKNFGRGGRGSRVFIDEAAAITHLQAIERSLDDTSPFMILGSTSIIGSWFNRMCANGRIRMVVLAWWDHPDKGAGRERVLDPETKEERWTSPWYRLQIAQRDRRSVQENLDMSLTGDGTQVFRVSDITQHRQSYASAGRRGTIMLAGQRRVDHNLPVTKWPMQSVEFIDAPGAQWRLWCEPTSDGTGRMRPDQSYAYTFGIDVSQGIGASESVISVFNADTRWKVARFSSSKVQTEQFAEIILIAAHWFGGRAKLPLIVPESNGPGQAVLALLRQWNYPRIYQHVDPGKQGYTADTHYGWHSDREEKRSLIEQYRRALARGEYRNPDADALEQCLEYIYYEDGGVGPSELAVESEAGRALHGDLVIADALSLLGGMRLGIGRGVQEPPVEGSFAWRKERRKSEKQNPLAY